jgi:multidrug resistance efflux pump
MPEKNNNRRKIMLATIGAIIVGGVIGGGAYYYVSGKTIFIDQSIVQAPIINLSPTNGGALQAVFVKAGDMVTTNEPVARVGDQIVEAKTNGEIVSVDQNIGEYENPLTGQANVATMIDPTQLRVVGALDENKGLANIQVGDAATFTVDAFGSKSFEGVVDEVAPSANQESVVFNISTQRPTNQFDVYIRFDPTKYPELKNGMSARVWIYTQ